MIYIINYFPASRSNSCFTNRSMADLSRHKWFHDLYCK